MAVTEQRGCWRQSISADASTFFDPKSLKFMSDAGVDVSPGSAGSAAMDQLSQSTQQITSAKAKTALKSGLTTLRRTTGNAQLKKALGEMIGA